jgi:hypothetical protein
MQLAHSAVKHPTFIIRSFCKQQKGYDTPEKLRRDLETARTILKVEPGSPLPIGVGFLGWILDKSETTSKELIALLFEYRVKAIWLSFGDNLTPWIEFVRELNQKSGGPSILIFVQICSLQEALTAINEWKADVVVVQGLSLHQPTYEKTIDTPFFCHRNRSRRSWRKLWPSSFDPLTINSGQHAC